VRSPAELKDQSAVKQETQSTNRTTTLLESGKIAARVRRESAFKMNDPLYPSATKHGSFKYVTSTSLNEKKTATIVTNSPS
jgi:hypothetical protein